MPKIRSDCFEVYHIINEFVWNKHFSSVSIIADHPNLGIGSVSGMLTHLRNDGEITPIDRDGNTIIYQKTGKFGEYERIFHSKPKFGGPRNRKLGFKQEKIKVESKPKTAKIVPKAKPKVNPKTANGSLFAHISSMQRRMAKLSSEMGKLQELIDKNK